MALAPRTWKGYLAVSTEFQAFRTLVGLELIWPAPVEHLQQFIVHLNRKGLVPGSIQSRMSALAFHARIHGCKDYTSYFQFKKMVKGWNKERGWVKDARALISLALLEKNCQQWLIICRAEYEATLFRAASLLTFFGTLRISEIVAVGKGDMTRMALQ